MAALSPILQYLSPLQSLTFIAAPALLTNACSLMILSTSNRFARAVDRARLLAQTPPGDGGAALARVERRALLLVRSLIALYTGVGAFSASTFTGLIGSVIATAGRGTGVALLTEISLGCAAIGVFSVATAGLHLVVEAASAYRGLLLEATTITRHRPTRGFKPEAPDP